MKTIGLLGGMSWESSAEYYRLINQLTKQRLGGHHSAPSVMVSVDFAQIEMYQSTGNWTAATQHLIQAAQQIERAGADCLVICTNTMHRMATEIQAAIHIPLLHIADATAQAIQQAGLARVGLLGTRYTMEQDFYKGRLVNQHGLDVLTPNSDHRQTVNRIIYDELVHGIIHPESKQAYLQVIAELQAQGAEAVILGCTEIGLLVQPADTTLPTFDTTYYHALAAVEWALGR